MEFENKVLKNIYKLGSKNVLILFTFLFFCFQSISSFGQTFYEASFTNKDGIHCKGFLVYYNESNCYMRVSFVENEEYNIVNIEYDASTGKTEDSVNFFMLLGKNPNFISFNQKNNYQPEHFIWLWDKSDSTNKPFYTTNKDADFDQASEVDYFKKVDFRELNEDYLDQFYISTDVDYLSFMQAINNPNQDYSNFFPNNKKPCMHLIVIANTGIGDIGQSCEIDKRNFISEFEGVAQALKIDIQKYVIEDIDYSKPSLLGTLEKIKPAKDDIIVFLYSGHGFRWDDQKDNFPQMDLRINIYQDIDNESTMGLSEVYNNLVSKGARLTIVLSNCCNSKVGLNQVTGSSFLGSMALHNFRKDNLSKLFLKSSGSILATASSPNEYAWCNFSNGGYFTVSFLQAFRQEISVLNNKEANWNGLMQNAVYSAKLKTSSYLCPGCSVQNGLISVKVK